MRPAHCYSTHCIPSLSISSSSCTPHHYLPAHCPSSSVSHLSDPHSDCAPHTSSLHIHRAVNLQPYLVQGTAHPRSRSPRQHQETCPGSCVLFLAGGFRASACVGGGGRGRGLDLDPDPARVHDPGRCSRSLAPRVHDVNVCLAGCGDGGASSRRCYRTRKTKKLFPRATCFPGRQSGRARVASGCGSVEEVRLGNRFSVVVVERSRRLVEAWKGKVGWVALWPVGGDVVTVISRAHIGRVSSSRVGNCSVVGKTVVVLVVGDEARLWSMKGVVCSSRLAHCTAVAVVVVADTEGSVVAAEVAAHTRYVVGFQEVHARLASPSNIPVPPCPPQSTEMIVRCVAM